MTITLIEVTPNAIKEQDFYQYGDYIYEHLRYYCTKFFPLPAVVLRLDGDKAEVVDAGIYLRVARDLGHQTIRAVFEQPPDESKLKAFLSRWSGVQLDWEAIDRAEQQEPVMYAWHVFFFERSLSKDEKRVFGEKIAGFFQTLGEKRGRYGPQVSEVSFLRDQTLAEFQAHTPVGDESWYLDFIRTYQSFSEECVPIVSYQGSRI